jgi:tetratricopeptide (TPR) repeat protein
MTRAEKKENVQTWEKIAAFVFGVVFLGIMLSIVIFIPKPTEHQFFIFREAIALAAAGIGAVVPGFLLVEWKPKSKYMPYIRAGGAIALFIIVYKVNPPALLQPENPTSIHQGKVEAKSIGHVNQNFGIPVDEFRKLAEELGVTKHALEEYSKKVDVTGSALKSFFKILEKQNVPPEDLDSTLSQIAERYKELQKKLVSSVIIENPEIKALKKKAEEALNEGDFDEAENLLNEASDKGIQCAKNMQEAANKCLISTAESKAELGDLKNTQLEYKAAAVYYLEAADLLPEESETLRAEYLNNCGKAFQEAGLYQDAKEPSEKALEIREKALGANHPDVARSLNNLARLYYYQGRYDDALPLYERALEIREKTLGKDHPDVAICLNNLGVLYYVQGRYEKTLLLHQRALDIREKTLGKDHPDTANSLDNLALVYDDLGRYQDSLPLHQRALEIKEKTLGKDHPDIANSLHNLAMVYSDQGRYEEALPLYQRALRIREKTLGKDHPDVASSLNNLAFVYAELGRCDDVLPLYQRALEIREKTLSKDHPDVASSLNNLALVYSYQGRYEDALPLYQRALVILEDALGPNHPGTKMVKNNLENLKMRPPLKSFWKYLKTHWNLIVQHKER